MRSSSKEIGTAIWTLLGGASGLSVTTTDPDRNPLTVPVFTSPQTGYDTYIWVRMATESNNDTKTSFGARGTMDIVCYDRTNNDNSSTEVIEDIKDAVLSTIQPTRTFTTSVSEVYEFHVENISPNILFTDDAKTFVATLTVNYQTCQ